jgi:hypothetical protein
MAALPQEAPAPGRPPPLACSPGAYGFVQDGKVMSTPTANALWTMKAFINQLLATRGREHSRST